MTKILTIAIREFTYNLRRPAFLFAVFGTPIIIALAFLVIGAIVGAQPSLEDYGKVGYIDNSSAQVLSADLVPEEFPGTFVRYDSVEAAESDARAGLISAYFELLPEYLDNGRVTLYTVQAPPSDLFDAINAMLRDNLAAGVSNDVAVEILTTGGEFNVTVQETNRTFGEEGAFLVLLLPVVFGFLLILSSVTTSSFLMSGLVEEKTNRIMEVLITSVSPAELLLGKLFGMGILGLLQVITFLVAGFVGLAIAERTDLFTGLTIPPDLVVLAIIFYLLAYFFMAAVGISIGAIVGSEQESRQLSAFFVMPVMLPYALLVTFIIDPNGSIPTALSLIPVTAPMAILMRSGLTAVPLWQILVSIAGLVLVNILVMWVSARLFRWGVLSTDKTPSLRRIIQVLRGRGPEIAPVHPRTPEAAS